ncbi:MAG: lytic transglycosylase domain-containing protein [Anaerolineae bacterium]|nr:lytic transglycosylase domain-containing protein [Anaerolineae bacterium]
MYQQDGQADLALQSYTGAAQAAPGEYFAIRADDLLNERTPFTRPAGAQFEFDDAQEQAEAEAWLRTTFGIQQAGPLAALSPALQADPRLIRGTELWNLADFAEAKVEFESLRVAYANDGLALYQLTLYYRDIGLYRSSIIAAADLLRLARADNFTAPRFLVRLRYPVYYKDLVLPEAEKHDVDPLLIFSLIRQESLFESFATSFAAAQGLMQIIPSTGFEIQQRIGWPAEYENEDVYRPYINVVFGVDYLRWTLNLVDNQPYAALAGYNGGRRTP